MVSAEGGRAKVDIVFTRARVAVFIDGCFWHGCPEHGHTPRANTHYWVPKLARTAARDKRISDALRRDGWRVLRIWEHVSLDAAVAEIVRALAEPSGGAPRA